MTNQTNRISCALAVSINGILGGSHRELNSLFLSAGAPEPVPDGSHAFKWRDWILATGRDPKVDNYEFVGALLEEFMDVKPSAISSSPYSTDSEPPAHGSSSQATQYQIKRKEIEEALAAEGLQYFRGGRIIPTGEFSEQSKHAAPQIVQSLSPTSIDDVLIRVLSGLRRAMYPFTHRRKGLPTLSFESEYDVQDLFHVLLRPWVKDIRSEEYTPSYAGKSTRMDFLLPDHQTVVELKFVRDVTHAKNIGQELIIDIGHYRRHEKCRRLWCAVFDPNNSLVNSEGLAVDIEGQHRQDDQVVNVRLVIL